MSSLFHARIGPEAELRQLEMRDAEALYGLVDRNREHLGRWLPWVDGMQSAGDEREFILKAGEQYEKDGTVTAGIWHEGRPAGTIGFVNLDVFNRSTLIGYWLSEEYQGRGLATAAGRAMVDAAFGDLGLNRVEIRAATENCRSRAVAERLGFRFEGVLRQSAWARDGFLDMAVYSLLRSEWLRARDDRSALPPDFPA